MATDRHWQPALGDLVWLNYPNALEPEGEVVGLVDDEANPRHGQPIIERLCDRNGMFHTEPKGHRFVIHPTFLLPFPFGGEMWRQANREGRVGDA